ncbi:MAG: hypothetical protein V4858_16395 [Pseudomonadota bacterium]
MQIKAALSQPLWLARARATKLPPQNTSAFPAPALLLEDLAVSHGDGSFGM